MYSRILVPVDGSATSDRGLEEAIQLARLTHGRLRLIHVIDELSLSLGMEAYAGYGGDFPTLLRENGHLILDNAKARVTASGVEHDAVIHDSYTGVVSDIVVDEAKTWHAELLVLGTHGRRGFRRMVLGSSAESILRMSTIPVLLIRQPETTDAPAAATHKPVHLTVPYGSLALE